MRLRQPEEVPGFWDVNVFEKAELYAMYQKNRMDQIVHAGELRRKCGLLEYLKNLAKGVRKITLLNYERNLKK